MTREHLIDQGLISDPAPSRLSAKLLEHSGIDTNRDQTLRLLSDGRSADSTHGLQLLRR